MLYSVLAAISLIVSANADCYLHLPRGSNNRLNEQAAQRDNANRLFDSQNNNRGGYNVGDLDPEDGFTEADYIATFDEMYNFDFVYQADTLQKQYEMLYFENSNISVTWTNQHGFGTAKLNSQIILQFICDTFQRDTTVGASDGIGPAGSAPTPELAKLRRHGLRVELYNGGNTNTPDATDTIQNGGAAQVSTEYNSNQNNHRGRRESEEYYTLCESRSRNYGLFHADQNLQGDSQIYTRQNPGGTRRGLECPEERDYYPWWNPSPFHDIAIITADTDYCTSTIAPNSQNVAPKYSCVNGGGVANVNTPTSYLPTATYVEFNLNETACTANGGTWESFYWQGASQPECVSSYWTKENYLGNVDNSKRGGKQAHYDWQIPSLSTLTGAHQCHEYSYALTNSADTTLDDSIPASVNCVRMMFRIRYNISTMDYDPYKTNSTMDYDDNEGIISPIQQNPTVDVGAWAQGLKLAINTAQTGRTFQDNSHTFLVCARPSDAAEEWNSGSRKSLINVNVRGKRGNIVQTFPATEYDFEPQHISITNNDCLHFQWEGSNTHNNGNPGGDGQTGDAGEGRDGSDRSNLAQLKAMNESYPLTYDKFQSMLIFNYLDCYHPLYPNLVLNSSDVEFVLGSAGFYKSTSYAAEQFASKGANARLNQLLNNVSGAFRQGLICCVKSNAVNAASSDLDFSLVSTRNNNFSNRDQKLKIIISNSPESPAYW